MKWNNILWGETTNWPVLPLLVTTVDGRAIVAVLPVLLHLSLSSIYFMLTSFLIFGILERFGYDVRTIYRMVRRYLGGTSMRSRNNYRAGIKKSGIFTLSLFFILPVVSSVLLPADGNAATYITNNTAFMEGGRVISSHKKVLRTKITATKSTKISIPMDIVKRASKGTGESLPFSIMAESVAPKGWSVVDHEDIITSWSFSGEEKWYDALIDWAEPLDQYLLVIDYKNKSIELRGVTR